MSYTAAVITISDKGAHGTRVDTSGPALCSILDSKGWIVSYTNIIPDEKEQIKAELVKCADVLGVNLVLTTGGTGFSPRDLAPEATLEVIERRAAGIPEAMRAESRRITPMGCLSRSEAGIRGRTLIINLPGSEAAAKENLMAVIDPVAHGLEMLLGNGSAGCGERHYPRKKNTPSMDEWLREAKTDPSANKIGMYLVHNGVVRETARAQVRDGCEDTVPVSGMFFSYDAEKVEEAIAETYELPGVHYVRVWLNEGELKAGEDIMYVLVGGDIRPHVVAALQFLVGRLKVKCVVEREIYI